MLHSPIHVGVGAEPLLSCSRLRFRHWHPISSGSTPAGRAKSAGPCRRPARDRYFRVFAVIHP